MVKNRDSFTFFENQIAKDFMSEAKSQLGFGFLDNVLERIEKLIVVLCHGLFDEVEAAMYLRLPDPYGKGRETLRNYALRTRKISYYKIFFPVVKF